MTNFIKLCPIQVEEMFLEDDKMWDLLILFAKMTWSPSNTDFETFVLREMIEQFCVDYLLRIIPEGTLKPKAHFLKYYLSQILEVGPLLNHSAISFQAKHNFF